LTVPFGRVAGVTVSGAQLTTSVNACITIKPPCVAVNVSG
jgi:hypothetical protein